MEELKEVRENEDIEGEGRMRRRQNDEEKKIDRRGTKRCGT